MTIFRDISVVIVLLETLTIFGALFEPRLPWNKTRWIYLLCGLVLIAGNMWGLLRLGAERMMQIMLLTCSIPSFLLFFAMAKHRDARFIFTFCIVDVMALWITGVTMPLQIIDDWWAYPAMLVLRMALFAALDVYVFRSFRKDYLRAQGVITKGWGLFSLISALFYVLMVVTAGYPTALYTRPDYLPAFFLLMLVVPMVLFGMVYTMMRQLQFYLTLQNERLVKIQLDSMEKQLRDIEEYERMQRVQRHDQRHRINQLITLLQQGNGGRPRLPRSLRRANRRGQGRPLLRKHDGQRHLATLPGPGGAAGRGGGGPSLHPASAAGGRDRAFAGAGQRH